MKRILVTLLTLTVLGYTMLFASETITNAQSTQVTAQMQGTTVLKLSRGSAISDIESFMHATSIEAIAFGTIEYGASKYKITDVYLNLASNAGNSITVNAIPQSPMTAPSITTKIGYKLSINNNNTNVVSISKTGQIIGKKLYTFTKSTDGMVLKSKDIQIALTIEDVNSAESGSYAATIQFELVID